MEEETEPTGPRARLLELIKGVSDEQIYELIKKGWLLDVLEADTNRAIDRDEFRAFLGVKPLLFEPIILTMDGDADPVFEGELMLSLTGTNPRHRKMGQVTFEKRVDGKLYANGHEVGLHRTSRQEAHEMVSGDQLLPALDRSGNVFLNGCFVDFVVAHPEMIPDDWPSMVWILCWDTTVYNAAAQPHVLGFAIQGNRVPLPLAVPFSAGFNGMSFAAYLMPKAEE